MEPFLHVNTFRGKVFINQRVNLTLLQVEVVEVSEGYLSLLVDGKGSFKSTHVDSTFNFKERLLDDIAITRANVGEHRARVFQFEALLE